MKFLVLIFLVTSSAGLVGQSDTTTLNKSDRVFLQVGLGMLPTLDPLNLEISAATGYRLNRHLGVGVEYRFTTTANISTWRNAQLLGLHARGQLKSGWTASLGVGTVLGGNVGDDGFTLSEYNSGGGYVATDLGYQFRWGGTLGVYATIVQGQRYDLSEFNLDTDLYEPTGRTSTEGLFGLGIKIGYALPRRDKRN